MTDHDDHPVTAVVVWERVYGPLPVGWELAHVNGDDSDLRIENLRLVPPGDE